MRAISRNLVERGASLAAALGAGAVLFLATWLVPDPRGFGTDTQLGLGTCTFLAATGYPCPMCGATTTFTLAAHLRPVEALLNQPFAFMLFVGTLVVFAISLAEVLQPRSRWQHILKIVGPWEGMLATSFLIAMGLGWIYKIAVMKWIP